MVERLWILAGSPGLLVDRPQVGGKPVQPMRRGRPDARTRIEACGKVARLDTQAVHAPILRPVPAAPHGNWWARSCLKPIPAPPTPPHPTAALQTPARLEYGHLAAFHSPPGMARSVWRLWAAEAFLQGANLAGSLFAHHLIPQFVEPSCPGIRFDLLVPAIG